MKIKKVYIAILALLEQAVADNAKVRVADVLDQVRELAKARVGEGGGGRATTFHKNAEGIVVAIRDFYFGKWFDPRVVETGVKANTPSGYNSMCKVGLNQWTKQQRVAKLAREELLKQVASGDVAPDAIGAQLEVIEEARNAVIPTDLPMYDSLDDLLATQV
ncbi:hypothetical protein [Caudoviricetes sp.]|nr:hypothetical protein [Caudoviricetes sp.]